MAEPTAKRQRTDDAQEPDLEKLQAALEQIGKVDEEVAQHDMAMAREIRAVESKHGKQMRPLLEKRAKLLGDIPHFWKQVLSNDPLTGGALTEHEEKMLDFLESLDVTYIDESGGFKIELTFQDSNPFLASKTLWKQVSYNDKSEASVTASKLEWKDTTEAKEAKEFVSFFAWFTSSDGDDDLAEHIKDDIWKNPVQYFLDEEDEDGYDDGCGHAHGDDDEDEDEARSEDDEE